MCRFARENNVAIAFPFCSLLNAKMRARLVGRIKQNIMLCRKFKVTTVIASFAKNPYEMRSPKNLMSLFVTLGMHPKEAKDGVTAAEKTIRKNIKKQQGYIGDGVEIIK